MSELLSEAKKIAAAKMDANLHEELELNKEIEQPIKIIIKADCSQDDSRDCFDGLSCDENFSYFFPFDTEIPDCVTGGYMHLKFDHESGVLYVFVIYDTTRKLVEAEEKMLTSYTQGQLSDGIGEGFEQQEFDVGVYNPSLWHSDQKIELMYGDE